jgi:hypothetical protein
MALGHPTNEPIALPDAPIRRTGTRQRDVVRALSEGTLLSKRFGRGGRSVPLEGIPIAVDAAGRDPRRAWPRK